MARGTKGQRRDGTRPRGKGQQFDHGINPAYRDMLDEANSSPTQTSDEGQTIKRRRVRGRIVAQNDVDHATARSSLDRVASSTGSHIDHSSKHDAVKPDLAHPLQQEQTAYKDESSEESDFAWEEVGLPQEEPQVFDGQQEEQEEQQLDLVLNGDAEEDSRSAAVVRRKPLTALERKLRLEVHKVHLLCLLSHVHLRNHWCNDQNIHVCSQPFPVCQARLRTYPESSVPTFAQAHRVSSQSR